MRITELQVDGFGMWKGLELGELDPGLTVLYGPNEAGKTTLLQFLRSVLYGLSDKRRGRYLPPVYGGNPGGQLGIQSPTGRFRAARHWTFADRDPAGRLKVLGGEGRSLGSATLRNALGGIDETLFNNVFAVGLTELQQLGSLSDTQAAQQLYGLAMGTDRVSLADVTQTLQQRRDALLAAGAEGSPPGPLRQLARRRSRILADLKSVGRQTRQWARLMQRREQLDAEIAQLRERALPVETELSWVEWIRTQRNHWKQCRELHSRLAPQPDPAIPDAAIQRLQEFQDQSRQRTGRWDENQRQLEALRLELGWKVEDDEPAWDVTEALKLGEERGRLRVQQESARVGRQKIEELELEFQVELEKHGLAQGNRPATLHLWDGDVLAALAEPLRLVHESQERCQRCERDAEEARREADNLKRNYHEQLARLGVRQVDESEQALQQLCQRLSQRMNLQDQLEQTVRQRDEVQRESQYWIQRTVVPWRFVLLFGATFSAGVTMLLVAWWNQVFRVPDEHRGAVALIGLCLAVASVVMRKAMEFSSQRRFDEAQHELRRHHRQLQQLHEEIQDLDRLLPRAAGPWIKQLEKAERELRDVRSLSPLHQQYQQLLGESEARQAQVNEANAERETAQRGWRQALLTLGLPQDQTPEQLQRLFSPHGPLLPLRSRLTLQRQEQKQREEEIEAVRRKVQQFAQQLDVDLILLGDELSERLEAVWDAAKKYREDQIKLAEGRKKFRELQREAAQLQEAIALLEKRTEQIVLQYRATNQEELESRYLQQQEDRETRSKRDQLLGQLVQDLAGHVSRDELLDAIGRDHSATSKDPVDRLLKQWNREYQTAEQSLSELTEQRGQLAEQLKALTRDNQAQKLKVELEQVEEQLRSGLREWNVLETSLQLLAMIRSAYEADRQPETLAEASVYLSRFTGGRYTRIWTPFGESSLSVDTRDGTALAVTKLSRGTREQVYLSLRLALAAEYARRGCPMPLVLDDVFVNFDTRRARAAVETVQAYAAQGHQVLVFTCHEHIRDMFRQLQVDVRSLPDARVVAGVATPEDVAQEFQEANGVESGDSSIDDQPAPDRDAHKPTQVSDDARATAVEAGSAEAETDRRKVRRRRRPRSARPAEHPRPRVDDSPLPLTDAVAVRPAPEAPLGGLTEQDALPDWVGAAPQSSRAERLPAGWVRTIEYDFA